MTKPSELPALRLFHSDDPKRDFKMLRVACKHTDRFTVKSYLAMLVPRALRFVDPFCIVQFCECTRVISIIHTKIPEE